MGKRLDVDAAKAHVLQHGPTRVVVNTSGYAVPPDVAKNRYGIEPDIVLIRDDGWSLGAPDRLVRFAEELWYDYWVARVNLKKEKEK